MRTLAVLAALATFAAALSKKSCDSECSDAVFPRCGVWMHEDNSKQVQGIYLLNQDTINLTCSINSLPKPAIVTWLHKSQGRSTFHTLRCSSSRTVTDCKYNDIGEHQVLSICTLKLKDLKQTGSYHCSGSVGNSETTSDPVNIKVYGISNLTLLSHRMEYNEVGHIQVEVCGNPKPKLLWIHHNSGTTVMAGHSSGNLTALPLQEVVTLERPAGDKAYCYKAKYFQSKVLSHKDGLVSLVASNTVTDLQKDYNFQVEHVPYRVRYPRKGGADVRGQISTVIIAVFCLLLRW